MNKYLWGLDLSLSCTGLTIYDLEAREFVYIGSFNTEKIKKKKDLYHNAIKIKHKYDWLNELKEQYPPRIIAIERGLSRFNTATQVIYRVHGMVNLMFWDIPQFYYPPKTVKEIIYKGTATKAEVQRVIRNNFVDVEFANEDESDSFAVALTYLIKEGLIEVEKPVVDKKKKKKSTTTKKSTSKKAKTHDLAEFTINCKENGII
jgi:Holliday junction resolvasome RuvABC endonuclease subunit